MTFKDWLRFWANVEKTAGCWHWITGETTGPRYYPYPQFRFNRKKYRAHRLIFSVIHGVIPQGLMVLHSCDNSLCVRPDHLSLGTQKENMADAKRKGRLGVPLGMGVRNRYRSEMPAK